MRCFIVDFHQHVITNLIFKCHACLCLRWTFFQIDTSRHIVENFSNEQTTASERFQQRDTYGCRKKNPQVFFCTLYRMSLQRLARSLKSIRCLINLECKTLPKMLWLDSRLYLDYLWIFVMQMSVVVTLNHN